MVNAVTRLKNNLSRSKDAYGFFFYAGHGVQSKGENYLIPVDANISSENYLPQLALSVQVTLEELNDAGNDLNVVVLDACRDNPFSWKRSGSRGLVVVTQQPAGSIVVFATSAGSTASDGDGRNGLFTTHFLTNLKKPGLEVSELFRLTGNDVARASGKQQFPEMHSKYYGTAYMGTKPSAQPAPAPVAVQPTPKPTPPPIPRDMVWIQGGTFTMGSLGSEAGREDDEGPQHSVTVSAFYMGKHEVTVGEFRRFVSATGYKTTAETSGGGYVWTGSSWEKKADANWKSPGFSQNDTHPVTQVSWYDTVEYCNWLSRQEGLTPVYTRNGDTVTCNWRANGYRLPTEAEWEYACRAGTTTPYYTGSSVGSAGWYSSNSGSMTHPVGQKQANAWGLYDMHGNVWEWCWDWYGGYSSGSQSDPAGASSGTYRVDRGGGWYSSAGNLRSANRGRSTPSYRRDGLGFRLVRPSL